MTDDLRVPEVHLPLWAKLLIGVPAIGFPLGILLFILRNDYVHDESRCPFSHVTSQRLSADVEIVEERRMCVDGVEDRRYTARRDDELRVLGSRRLPPAAFEAPAYQWHGEVRDGQVHLKVTVGAGHPEAQFREGTEEERNP